MSQATDEVMFLENRLNNKTKAVLFLIVIDCVIKKQWMPETDISWEILFGRLGDLKSADDKICLITYKCRMEARTTKLSETYRIPYKQSADLQR